MLFDPSFDTSPYSFSGDRLTEIAFPLGGINEGDPADVRTQYRHLVGELATLNLRTCTYTTSVTKARSRRSTPSINGCPARR